MNQVEHDRLTRIHDALEGIKSELEVLSEEMENRGLEVSDEQEADDLEIGASDCYVASERVQEVVEALEETVWSSGRRGR